MDTNLTVAYASEITAAAARHHLDPRLLAAVAAQETGGPGTNAGRNIVGDGGHGRGLFQIDDRWHAFARSAQALDPARNADYAAGLIGRLLSRYGDVRKALSAYNAGDPNASGTRTDWGGGTSLAYADSVLRHYAALGGGAPAAQAEPDASSGLRAESLSEQAGVGTLMSFALGQPPGFTAPRSYRDVAALDDSGRSKSRASYDFVDPDSSAES